jgi:sugar lactone lactonase YvrE
MMSITTRIASLASALALALGGTVLLTAPANAADIDPAPINTIIGSNVDLWAGEGLAVATDGTIYVSRWTQGDVLVYAPGATANALPEFVITGLIYPTGVALDPAGNLWVAERNVRRSGDGAIVEFAVGADGSATPLRDIEGLTTTLNDPTGITFDSAGNLYVAENPTVGAAILEFPKDATGDVPPLRTITGPLTFLSLPGGAPFGIAIASDGSIVVSTAVSGASAIAVFAPGAEGNVAPQRTITGSATQLDNNRALVLDAAGRIYASNLEDESAGSGSQTIYAANASGNAAPIERLTGATTGMNNVYYIALDAHGNLWVVNNGATKSGPSSITEYAALPAVTHISQSTGSPAGGESTRG